MRPSDGFSPVLAFKDLIPNSRLLAARDATEPRPVAQSQHPASERYFGSSILRSTNGSISYLYRRLSFS